MLIDHFKEHSQAIAAQRQSAKVTYCLFEALFGSLCTVIADAKGWFDRGGKILVKATPRHAVGDRSELGAGGVL